MPGHVTEPVLRCVLPFEAAPAEVSLLRKAAVRQLGDWGVPVATDEAELLIVELATNVLKHVGEGTPATLILEWRGPRLRVEVHDKSHTVPVLKPAGCDEECGRGLHLVTGLAVDWGTVMTAAGKAVWCELPLGAGNFCRRLERAAEALENYRSAGPTAALEESAVELIADLLHLATVRGHNPDDILDRAQTHYEAEAA
ncbi:ATP-binding protein [Streptomyces sp. NPDC091279]|uniref:ATP-binding protein n=1 Tax=unclassified Streptomyces TaxID=2593676 RepID=UPI00382C8710